MKPSCDTNYFFIETFAVCDEDERLNDSSEYMLNIEGNGKKLLNDFLCLGSINDSIPAADYMVLQKVFFPFSIYAAFAPYKSLVAYGDLFCRSFKTAWLTDEDTCIYFPKQSPFLRSKTV